MTAFRLSENIDKNKVFLVNKSQIEKRLDPFYYVPELMELEEKVWQKNPQKLIHYAKAVSSGATPKTTESEKYYTDKENGIPFLRVQNLTSAGRLKLDNVKFINEETHNGMLARSKVKEGDLLIKITGVGRMAVSSVAPEGFEGNVNQHMVVMKTDSPETSKILAAFLNADIGEKLASRRTTGGTRPALDYPALLSIPIIYDDRILKISEAAVKKKETKEQQAKELLASIDDYLLGELGIKMPELDNSLQSRMFKVNFSKVSGNRFDPKLYELNAQKLFAAVEKSPLPKVPLKSLLVQSVSGEWGLDENAEVSENQYEKCVVIRATEFDNDFNLNVENSRVKYRKVKRDKLNQLDVQENDLLLEKSGGSPDQPVGRIAIIDKSILAKYSPICFSNFIQKLRADESKVLPEYLFCYLKSIHNIKITEVMQSQTSGIRNLITREYFNQSVVLPSTGKQKELTEKVGKMRDGAFKLFREAEKELEKASREVEGLILNPNKETIKTANHE
jgi:type I restriction enzyme, S subunit